MPTIILAAGHGRRPNGTWDTGTTWHDLEEHRLNEQAMWACYDTLRAAGIDVKLERGATRNTEDRRDPNWVRFRADLDSVPGIRLAVELHHDYWKAARGGFGIWSRSVGYKATAERAVCATITGAYRAAGIPTRPSYGDVRGLGLLRRPRCPTLIWELDRLGPDTASTTDTGRAVADGIAAWLTR